MKPLFVVVLLGSCMLLAAEDNYVIETNDTSSPTDLTSGGTYDNDETDSTNSTQNDNGTASEFPTNPNTDFPNDDNSTTESPTTAEVPTTPEEPETTTSVPSPGDVTTYQPIAFKPRGVTDLCLAVYTDCTKSYRAERKSYCESNKLADTCITTEAQSNPSTCTHAEQKRLYLLDCGPATVFIRPTVNRTSVEISNNCLDRVTDCISVYKNVFELNNLYQLRDFFCESVKQDKDCLQTDIQGEHCTANEYRAALTITGCSSGSTLLSSILFVTLAFLLQKMVGEA
uniref:Uncharacterized protein n=1 Tax=Arion vulgaris TaxID=1028688 RepID=A0A0B6ZZP9_9EUPU